MAPGSSQDQPPPGSRRPLSGGLFHGPDAEAQLLAAIRDRAGDEAAECWQRSRELLRHPRPLTDPERGVVRETTAPLLRDLAASGMTLPDIREEARHYEGTETVCAWIQGPGGTGEGISIRLDCSPAERVAWLAEQFQNWAADQLHDAGRPPEWPECPEHPVPHRLEPEVRDGAAVWTCLQSDHVIWEIGALVTPNPDR